MNSLVYSSNFANNDNWMFIIPIIILLGALLIGNILRFIPYVRKSLIPASLLGGTIVLLLALIPGVRDFMTKWSMVIYNSSVCNGTLPEASYNGSLPSVNIFESITFHTLALGFIAMSLKNKSKKDTASKITIFKTGALTASTYILQAIIGIIVGLCMLALPAAGIILCLGFGQGPAQAMNWSGIYSTDYSSQFHGGTSFGLAIACIGFIVASIVGVTYMNILRKRGKLTVRVEDRKREIVDYEGENEIPATESVDKFSIQLALIFSIYGITFLALKGLDLLKVDLISNLAWGFNFLFGVIFASLFKIIYNKLRKKGVIKREYINNYLLDRIAGFMFDLMIVAGTAAIIFSDIKDYIWPIAVMCSIGTIFTIIYVRIVCNHLYKGYENEGFFSMFGMLTGTASNGVILLREIDPNFETPAANNLVLQNFPAIIFGAPILLLCSFAPKSTTNTIVTLIIICLLFVLFNVFLFSEKIFGKTKNKEVINDGSRK